MGAKLPSSKQTSNQGQSEPETHSEADVGNLESRANHNQSNSDFADNQRTSSSSRQVHRQRLKPENSQILYSGRKRKAPSSKRMGLPSWERSEEKQEEKSRPRSSSLVHGRNDQDASYDDFIAALRRKNLEIKEQKGDGNCLFRSVALQVYGDSNCHVEVRKNCMDYIEREREYFQPFLPMDEDFEAYINRKRQDKVHGNNPELQALSEIYNRPIEIFCPENGGEPINIFQSELKTNDLPIRLSYEDGNHYNAIIDPYTPTAGLGLGLADLRPGLADKQQLDKAKIESDQFYMKKMASDTYKLDLKKAMEESRKTSSYTLAKKNAAEFSELEQSEFDIKQAILLSSLESYQRDECSRKTSANSHFTHASTEKYAQGSDYSSSQIHELTNRQTSSFNTDEHNSTASTTTRVSATTTSNAFIGDEYPDTVQELVMNGFELSTVLKAYDLVGDNFDSMLCFLMSSSKK